MTPAELVARALAEGVRLSLDGDRVRFHGRPSGDVLADVRGEETVIAAWLRLADALGPDGAQMIDDILDARGWLEARDLLPAGLWTAERLLAEVFATATRSPTAATAFVRDLYAAELECDDVRLRAMEGANSGGKRPA